MSDSGGQLARAAARIEQLERDIAAALAAAAAAGQRQQDAEAALAAARGEIAGLLPFKARAEELEPLLADPPEGSGVQVVHYVDPKDGAVLKRRFRASDGEKFKLLPDARQYQAALEVRKQLSVTLDQAKQLVEKRDAVRGALDIADSSHN